MKISKSYRKFLKFFIIIILLSAVYFGGYLVGHKNIVIEQGYKPKIENLDLGKPSDVDFSIFWQAWNIATSRFYEKNLDVKKMVYGAISGMLASLKDPYTQFLNPEIAKQFEDDLNGSFDGIGAEIQAKDGALVIVAPLDGSPAKEAGIRSGDVIVKIDEVEVDNYTFIEAINHIRGKKGTPVKLTILRKGEENTQDITITRDTIVIESVKWEMKDGNIMYVRISQFGEDTQELIDKMAEGALKKKVSGMVIDLRDNPGGLLDQCIDITSLFIPEGTVVIEKDRDGKENKSQTTQLPRLKDIPLVVLVNEGSASASEIMAGAIQDAGRGKLIGEKTFGKGSVQSIADLKDDSEVKITVAKWFTPKGRGIDKEGIEPDIKVELSDDDIKNNRDPQLDKALDELRQ